MNAKTMLLFAASEAASLAMADGLVPSVSNVAMAQQDHSRTVTITYDLADAAAVVTFDVQTNKTGAATNDDAEWVSLGGANVCNATGDVWKKVETGSRTITWYADKSWRGFKVSAARAVVTAWSVDNPPDYLVVDISATGGAGTERYYPVVDFLPGGLFGNSDYRLGKIVMRKIPAKDVRWLMGSANTETGYTVASEKMHEVMLTDNYYIGVFEVTQTQYEMLQTSYAAASAPKFKVNRAMRPVESVCYNELRRTAHVNNTSDTTSYLYPAAPNPASYLGLLREKTGLLFDLPSEAQWEYACRAGNGVGCWGDGSLVVAQAEDANLNGLGRYGFNGGKVTDETCDVTNGTAIVGTYAPNAWGLYDMHGNALEICLDMYEDDISDLNGAVNTNAEETPRCVRRGGGYTMNAKNCRSAYRGDTATLNNTSNVTGFRLALPIPSAVQQ